ncbi:MAG: efflux RND transporter periplasmic adaptor subunit [Spirochaetaceae bacterium]|nr:efflux RND transporter periplasmic adaptor subunit [Spirochaetaceae bacterium]
MLKKRITLITTLVLMTLIYSSCSEKPESEMTSSATWTPGENVLPISVEALEVTEGKLIPYIEASGIIYGRKEAWAVSETQGKITEMKVIPGQTVKAGDILLKVEDRMALLNRDLALLQYESNKLDFQAIESSYKTGGYSRSDYNSARSRLLQAQNAYESAAKAFEDTAIRSPFDGSVALIGNSLSEGNFLTPGIPVARIIDTSSMKMEISVGERQVNLIKAGIKAEVMINSGFNRETIDAEVEAIGTGTDPSTGSFPVLISWDNKPGLNMRSGLSGRVRINTLDETNQIIIPSSAIVIRDRKESVIVAEDNKTRIKPIEKGEALGGHSVVVSGLEKGEILIVSALSSLGNDYSVEPTIVGTTGEWR